MKVVYWYMLKSLFAQIIGVGASGYPTRITSFQIRPQIISRGCVSEIAGQVLTPYGISNGLRRPQNKVLGGRETELVTGASSIFVPKILPVIL
jgi:hypothetical protein